MVLSITCFTYLPAFRNTIIKASFTFIHYTHLVNVSGILLSEIINIYYTRPLEPVPRVRRGLELYPPYLNDNERNIFTPPSSLEQLETLFDFQRGQTTCHMN